MYKPHPNPDSREARYAAAARIGAIVCVTFVIAAASFHRPIVDEVLYLDTAATAAATDGYYMPSQYDEANLPNNNAEPAPTF